jgi:hypothetical protein
MNFKIAIVGAAMMAFGGLFAVGCGADACTTAGDDIAAKQASCPKPPPVVTTSSTTGTAAACTDASGKILTCQATAIKAASCDCLGFGDSTKCLPADSKTFLDAFTACK